MKNQDLFSKRFLSISLGISAILLSGSLFFFSVNSVTTAKADSFEDLNNKINVSESILLKDISQDDDEDIRAIQAFGIGIRDGNLYFGILYNNNTIGLHKSDADSEDVLDW